MARSWNSQPWFYVSESRDVPVGVGRNLGQVSDIPFNDEFLGPSFYHTVADAVGHAEHRCAAGRLFLILFAVELCFGSLSNTVRLHVSGIPKSEI